MTERPVVRVRSQADLEAHWRSLMEPLGFAGRALWIAFLADDGEVLRQLVEISDMPHLPDRQSLDGLTEMMRELSGEEGISRYSFLLARPGRGGAGHDDRAWTAALHRAARDAGVRCEPVHLATDRVLVPITLDDLGALAG